MVKFNGIIIPDILLDLYLEDKILVKPDYGYSTIRDDSAAVSRYAAARAAEDVIRKQKNNGVKRDYRLK